MESFERISQAARYQEQQGQRAKADMDALFEQAKAKFKEHETEIQPLAAMVAARGNDGGTSPKDKLIRGKDGGLEIPKEKPSRVEFPTWLFTLGLRQDVC